MRLSDNAVQRGEAVEGELNRFIEHRSRQFGAEAANGRARAQERDTQRRDAERRARHSALWQEHHQRLAAIHALLAEQNRAKAAWLASFARDHA